MTVLTPAPVVTTFAAQGSDLDFGATIDNINVETMTGK